MVSQSADMIRTRSNGVVPHCSQASDCRANGHVGPLQKRTAKALITGGGGYFGYHLGCALAREEIHVVLFDRQKPRWEVPNRAVFFQVKVPIHMLRSTQVGFGVELSFPGLLSLGYSEL